MSGGKTQSTSGTVTQTSEPWGPTKPFYEGLFKGAEGLYQSQGTGYAGPNQTQRTALGQLQGVADWGGMLGQRMQGAAEGMGVGANETRQLGQDVVSGKYLHPDSNPYLTGAIRAGIAPIWEGLTREVLPGIRSNALMAGQYGGDRTDLVMGQAMGDAYEAAMNKAMSITYDNYGRERTLQMQAPQLFGQANNITGQQMAMMQQALGTQTGASQLLGATGDQQQGWDQSALDAPWAQMARFASLLGSGGFGSQATSSSVPRSSSMFQGAVGGGALGYQAGQAAGVNPQMAALIAAALGGGSGY